MLRFNMSEEKIVPEVGLIAGFAGVRSRYIVRESKLLPIIDMSSLVILFISNACESFPAIFAGIWSHACVDPRVN